MIDRIPEELFELAQTIQEQETTVGRRWILKWLALTVGGVACSPILNSTPTPSPTETPKPTPTLTPEPTPSPEPKVERNPLPEYGVFSGDVFTVDEKSGARTQTGKIIIASIPRSEVEIQRKDLEKLFFYYVANSGLRMPAELPVTKIEGNRVLATLGDWRLDVALIQPDIGKGIKPILQGDIQGTIPGGKIEATQIGTCRETLEREIKSIKKSTDLSELARRGIVFPDSCPASK